LVRILKGKDPAAVGRVFKVLDPGETGAIQVVRPTWMRIETVAGGSP
jgi:hypothetical protein